jgi:hypothetical protein
MGRVIQFEEAGVAHLRDRLGAAEEANQDLIAFRRSGRFSVTDRQSPSRSTSTCSLIRLPSFESDDCLCPSGYPTANIESRGH